MKKCNEGYRKKRKLMKKPGIVHDIFFIVRVELLKQYMEISNMEVT